jgi:RpiB/LacA/LacB family sugar-phosphate isomerase
LNKETIILGSDHAGFALKEYIKTILSKMNYPIEDLGTSSKKSVDYPDYAEKVALAVRNRRNGKGILTCATGIGSSVVANKIPGIRAALVHNVRMARLSREHNKANILVLGGRPYEKNNVRKIIKTWLKSEFKGGRHKRRIGKISKIERKYIGI